MDQAQGLARKGAYTPAGVQRQNRARRKFLRLGAATVIIGLIGWCLIRVFAREEEMRNLRKMLGDDWFEREVSPRLLISQNEFAGEPVS